MPINTPYLDLKTAIIKLEAEKATKEQLLRDQFKITYDNISPLNIIKNTFSSFAASPEVRNSFFTILLPLATGFISKKVFAGTRSQKLYKQAGVLILDALNRYVSNNPEAINSISHYILNLFHKKKSPDKQAE